MKYRVIVVALALVSSVTIAGTDSEEPTGWAWVHRAAFAEHDYECSRTLGELRFAKEKIGPFTQLILSWNALRPKKGHFSFHAQVRDTKTKKWGHWHKVADWGAKVQRTYASKSDGMAKNVYVRLELEAGNRADAFRVKVMPHDMALLKLVKGVAVALADFTKFKPENGFKSVKELPSVLVNGLWNISQKALAHPDKGAICSAVSSAMLASHVTQTCLNPYDFVRGVYDSGLGIYGSWQFSTAHAFDRCAGKSWFYPCRLNSFQELHEQLQRGIPVVVSVRGALTGAPKTYFGGHILVVRGWDAERKQVICNDPAFLSHKATVCRYDFKEFLRAWERSNRLVYWTEPVRKT